MKRNSIFLVVLTLWLSVFFGCKDSKQPTEAKIIGGLVDEEVIDTTIYGRCVDGGMSSLLLVNESGDTVEFVLETVDTVADVQGGVFVGDKMAIIGEEVDGELFAKKVINLTSLLGKWTSLDRNFDIKDNGVVESHLTTESNPYTSWSIVNGRLVLSSDTFDVLSLGHDSLSLENKKGIYVFKRQK
ncbi:MAG: hypothetical protein II950_02640 [Prevotella sp.]|nr:hypothetical protein [Prevotella sp.]